MTTIVWRFTDGKPGHDSQSQGLLCALCKRADILSHDIPVEQSGRSLWSWLSGACRYDARYAPPDLLIGAGHATHWHLLAARRRWGGRTIVLMKPSLPLSWFDLCLVPEHDGPLRAANVLSTLGSVNNIQAGGDHDVDSGLIILGGPSRHYRWNDDQMLSQLERLIEKRPLKRWLITTSRRTPQSTLHALSDRPGLCFVPGAVTGADWLPARMADAGEVWVSEDSVSMIYEALTAGARLGLLQVSRRRAASRVASGVDALVARGWVGSPGQWRLAAGPGQPINEAARCAEWINRQWLVKN